MIATVIIPCFNEEKTVKELIEKVKNVELGCSKEIIVVDDGSTDGSYSIINKISGIKILRHSYNRGKGAAIKTGLAIAQGNIVVIQDADLELDPAFIPSVINPIILNEADVVYGSRNLFKKNGKRTIIFYLGGILVTSITNFLYKTKLSDEPCGFKAFKIEILRELKISGNRFEWEPEVTAKLALKGILIKEVPVSVNSRTIKEGKKLRRRDGIVAILTLFKYRLFKIKN